MAQAPDQQQQDQPMENGEGWVDASEFVSAHQSISDNGNSGTSADDSSEPQASPVVSFNVKCRTADDKLVVVPSHILFCSKVFAQMCGDLEIGVKKADQDEVETFPGEFFINNVREEIFLKVIKWCEEHMGQPEPVIREHPITKERVHFVFTDFETEFLNVSVQELSELLMASNYLDIPSLYLYGCQRAAQLMTSKTIEEVREDWGFEDDIPEEEKQRILKEFAWCLPSAPTQQTSSAENPNTGD